MCPIPPTINFPSLNKLNTYAKQTDIVTVRIKVKAMFLNELSALNKPRSWTKK